VAALKVHPLAQCDREAALLYLQRESPRAAMRFAAELERARRAITRQPLTWPLAEPGVRRYKLRKFPYAVLYRVVGDNVWIVAIADLRRQPGYWRDRLQDLP
jgi:plasmid stabilization system protein ParE